LTNEEAREQDQDNYSIQYDSEEDTYDVVGGQTGHVYASFEDKDDAIEFENASREALHENGESPMTESKRKKQVRRWKHLKERYNKLYRSLKEDEDLSTRREHLPSAGEIIDLEADGSIDREHAIGKLTGRGYDDDAAADMVDNYNSAEELEEAVRSPDEAREEVYRIVPRADVEELVDQLVHSRTLDPQTAIEILMEDYGVPPWAASTFVEDAIGPDPLEDPSVVKAPTRMTGGTARMPTQPTQYTPSATPAETKVNEMVPRDTQAYYRDAVYTGEMIPLEVITDLEIDYGVPDWAAEEWVTAVTGDS